MDDRTETGIPHDPRRPTRRTALGLAACAMVGTLARLSGSVVSRAAPGDRKRHHQRRRKHRQRKANRKPLYPDLQTVAPKDLRFGQLDDGTHVLRFTNTVWNAGPGRLELEGNPDPNSEGTKELFQNIYDKPFGGRRVIHRRVNGEIVYHPTHNHYHFADFASYQLLQQDEGGVYQPVGEGTKTSFCITDNTPVGRPDGRTYVACDRTLQGLSPGWGDTYDWTLPEQWVVLNVWPLPDGAYGLQSTADPRDLLDEGGGTRETNNAAVTYFTVVSGEIIMSSESSASQTHRDGKEPAP